MNLLPQNKSNLLFMIPDDDLMTPKNNKVIYKIIELI